MKKFTRILALLLALGLVAAACGSDDPVETGSDDTTTTTAEAMEDDATTTTAEAMDDEETTTTAEAMDDEFLFDLGGREITIAVENAYLPFNYIDATTGEAAGWDYAAIDDICSRLNCVPKYETFDWDPMIQAVSDGQFDMAADGITITDERAQVVDFSDGYINIDQRILVAIDNGEIASEADLVAADCAVAVQGGTTNAATAERIVGADRLTLVDDFGFAVQAVIVGDACATIIDETAGQGYIGENPEKIKLVGESLSADQLGFIFPKGSDLVEPFNMAISAMKEDGTMAALGEEYFSGAFTITYDDIQ